MHYKKKSLLPFVLRSACVLWVCIAGAAGNGTAPLWARLCLMAVSAVCAGCCYVLAEIIEKTKEALIRGFNTDKRNPKG